MITCRRILLRMTNISHKSCIEKFKKRITDRISQSAAASIVLTLGLLMSYTGWNRRNVPDFGRVFLMLKYTDITQNTYIQS